MTDRARPTWEDRTVRRGNVFTESCALDGDEPDGYRTEAAAIAGAADGDALAVKVFELPPGQSVCPYHYEYEQEWLVVLEGTITVRTPEGEQELGRGEIASFAAGPQGAHKVGNRSADVARIMMFSSAREPAVAVYPDSDKIGVWPGNPADEVVLRRVDGGVDYWDGER
jgi:uncharacterized cupin superfamily protein